MLNQLLNDEAIYKLWPFKTRYLSIEGWNTIKNLILLHNITSVLEFGSGLSTILLNNLGVDVLSYETDPIYMRTVKSFNLSNVEFRLWDNISTTIEGTFGLSLVDGILPRVNQLLYAQKHSRYIAIDDFNDDSHNESLQSLLLKYTCIDGIDKKLAIFRRFN